MLAREFADITVPVVPTRDWFVAVRARTLRLLVLERFAVLERDTTLREFVLVVRVGVTEREETFLVAVPRDTAVLDAD